MVAVVPEEICFERSAGSSLFRSLINAVLGSLKRPLIGRHVYLSFCCVE